MKTVAPHDRPREKLQRVGAGGLGDNELLAIVLGHGVPRTGALELANAVLDAVGGLHGLARATTDDLRRVPGIGGARAARRGAPRGAAVGFLGRRSGTGRVERCGWVRPDRRHGWRRPTVLSVGTLDASIVHRREVFRAAATAGAAALVLFHNHPSGDPTPSDDDIALTRRLVRAGDLMGLAVLDHVIVAESRFCSLRERGELRD